MSLLTKYDCTSGGGSFVWLVSVTIFALSGCKTNEVPSHEKQLEHIMLHRITLFMATGVFTGLSVASLTIDGVQAQSVDWSVLPIR